MHEIREHEGQSATTTDSAQAISVGSLSKCYRVYESPRARLLQMLVGERRKLYKEIWALQDVTFELAPGQCLGVVGRNGSGKSTLLQILCGTLTPSSGFVETRGRVGALLELGSGFNPDFTGLENIYLNASLLGLSRQEAESKLDDILAFADIGDFVNQPVRNYSSGMAVRLAFAVQAQTDPEILIVDEALAVGDEMFQRKCYSRLEQMREKGCSILLVTHHCPTVIQHCDQALLLHKGRLRLQDSPNKVTALYQQLAQADDLEWNRVLGLGDPGQYEHNQEDPGQKDLPSTRVIYPPRGAQILDGRLINQDQKRCKEIFFGEPFTLQFIYRADQDLHGLGFGCHISDPSGRRYTGQVYPEGGNWTTAVTHGETWEINFFFRAGLLPGTYFVGAGIWNDASQHHFIHRVIDFLVIRVLQTDGVPRIGTCDLTEKNPTFERTHTDIAKIHDLTQASNVD